MTAGEKDALRVAVNACWNVGALSMEALRTTVTVGFSVGQDGVPDAGSIALVDAAGGSDTATRQAYEAARRAIISRCRRRSMSSGRTSRSCSTPTGCGCDEPPRNEIWHDSAARAFV